MITQQIPRDEWPAFFNSFSRKHEGWLVNVQILGPNVGAQMQEQELALEGITDEWDEAEGNTIIIMTGSRPDDHITHSISRPIEVSLEQTDEGADVALAIKAADGNTALLQFCVATRPEWVDAVA